MRQLRRNEVIIMKVQKNGDEEFLIPVEDDEELERAFVAFQEQSEFCEDDEDDEEDGEEK